MGGVGRRRNVFEGRKRGDLRVMFFEGRKRGDLRVMFFEGSFPLLLNRVIDLGKGKKGNYPRFRKKYAHYEFGFRKKNAQNDFVTNLDNFCDRIFNGVGTDLGTSWEMFGKCLGNVWNFLLLIIK